MRRAFLVAIAAAWMLVVAPPAAADPVPFNATFQEFFGKSAAHPCQGAFYCGTGSVAGFGEATSTVNVLDFSGFDPETGCATAVTERVIRLSDGSTVTLIATEVVCTPGRSTFAPGAMKSFGNPTLTTGTFTVVSGTGEFAGATGTGTLTTRLAGESGHTTLSGTVDL